MTTLTSEQEFQLTVLKQQLDTCDQLYQLVDMYEKLQHLGVMEARMLNKIHGVALFDEDMFLARCEVNSTKLRESILLLCLYRYKMKQSSLNYTRENGLPEPTTPKSSLFNDLATGLGKTIKKFWS
ncbi:MAG: hypothetical protein ACRC1X_08725 [Lactobacillus panisapium]